MGMSGTCWITGGISCCGVDLVFGVVLRIPWRGRFMWPFAVAGIGFRYLRISFSEMLGHPFRNPVCVAVGSLDILGLHSDWCANLTLLALVAMEWAKTATCLTVFDWAASPAYVGVCVPGLMGMVHRTVAGSLCPCNIILSLYIILQ